MSMPAGGTSQSETSVASRRLSNICVVFYVFYTCVLTPCAK